MPDLEKVVNELESLRDICNAKANMAIGKGKIAWAGYANAADDAIALLKEKPEIMIEQAKVEDYWAKKCRECELTEAEKIQECQLCRQR